MKQKETKKIRPGQEQERPGKESNMKPQPKTEPKENSIKLEDKIALITGGGIG